ncbi:MAG TPA: hypothetical protein VIG29_05630 [Vicinamibacteria bacterium]
MSADSQTLTRVIDDLVDQYRGQCLWFLRPDYYPRTPEEQLRILDTIQRYGDRKAFQKAAEARQWLLQQSSARSAVS